MSQQKSKDVLEILKTSENDRECETHLVLLLGYDCFEFIKVLVKNRDMVLYCTLLLTSSDDTERDKVMDIMRTSSSLKRILDQVSDEKFFIFRSTHIFRPPSNFLKLYLLFAIIF